MGQSEVGSDGWGRIWDGYTNAPFNTGERGSRQDCRKNRETRRDRQPNAHHISYQQAAVASNAVQVTAHGASPGDTTSQLLAGDEAPPLSEEGTVALRCTGNTPFGNL